MYLIHDHLHEWNSELPKVALRVGRDVLAKRRWRGAADDGSEFGFDLEYPLEDGDVFHQSDAATYSIVQKPEPVLAINLHGSPAEVARLGWLLGNLHFQIGIVGERILTVDDPATRQLLIREHIAFTSSEDVFRPLSGGHSHNHPH